jgi:hypothetical protein
MVPEHPLFKLVYVEATSNYTPPEIPLTLYVDPNIAKGRASWELKHKYLGCDPNWHELWELTIPNNGCSCTIDYLQLKKENPPDFSSPEKYFLWGHKIHNLINVKLNKPLVTIEEAIHLWNRTDIILSTDQLQLHPY